MIPDNIFPWQAAEWQQLWRCRQANKLTHALLLIGAQGMGKRHFANVLASAVLCRAVNNLGMACGQCHACCLLNAKSHPDLMVIVPEEDSYIIGVDRIREVVHFVSETAQQGGYRVIIIDPAMAMNTNAANALLKILEEPSARVLFMLLSDQSMRLPATILSRCQKILFKKPVQKEALLWLATNGVSTDQAPLLLSLADGAPLKAKSLLETDEMLLRNNLYKGLYALSSQQADPLQLAAVLYEQNSLVLLNFLQGWLRDLLCFKVTQVQDNLLNIDYKNMFVELSAKISFKNLLCFIDQVQAVYAKISYSVNLNRQLLLEDLFIQWTHYVSC